MNNYFLEYYKKYNISPVKQNLENEYIFFQKREKLYRQLGMPIMLFKGKDILEVGSGSGFNTLAFFLWKGTEGNKIDLVEANPTGIREMRELFKEKNISDERFEIYESSIEEFNNKKYYDIIIAEGFIHAISNAKEIIHKLCTMLKQNGIIVITCMDECSVFVEEMKRLVVNMITKDINNYEEKVSIYTDFFQPQLKKLKGMSRSIEDWVKDDMLNPAFYNNSLLSLEEAVKTFPDNYYILGSSQRIFTDYSWYKDLLYNERENIVKQFKEKQHNFILAGEEETLLPIEKNKELNYILCKIRENAKGYEESKDDSLIREIINSLGSMLNLKVYFSKNLCLFIEETIEILQCLLQNEEIKYSDYKTFYYAVGRTQQYLSMVNSDKKEC
ncbi:MAG: methyltransferase domain-containing protein [Lachnospiraceae bacterium]|jgi:2-polyprenyl-3-methyl-5-hydroxy-6-metoxy-1,4-benzoquinol methylase|nr:methyltransferase domain-containing protein [Lachnospiraceae bacterium]